MEPKQIEKRLDWLDEQRRKETDLLGALQEQLNHALGEIESQGKQIKDLSSEVTRLTSQTSRMGQFDDDLNKQREDFLRRIDDLLERQAERDRHMEKIRSADREELSKAISEIRSEIKELEKIEQTMEARRQEEIRISSQLDELEKSVDQVISIDEDTKRSISMIDDARKMDSKRIADLQAEATDLRKRIDSLRGTLDAVADRAKKSEKGISEIIGSESGRNESQKLWIEQQELKLIAFEKEWKSWQKAFVDFEENAENLDQRMLKYDENYRAMRQTRSDLDKMIERLERRITEISEIQRIAEDRLKHDWGTFLADDTKRWNTFKLNNDEQWREHTRVHESLKTEMEAQSEYISESMHSLARLSEQSQSRVVGLLKLVQEWATEVETKIGEIK